MSIAARRELVSEIAPRYRSAGKADKGRILDELVATTGYDRKHAMRLLKDPPPLNRKKRPRKRKRVYGQAEQRALERLWPVSGYLGSRRFVAALAPLMEALERHGEWVPEPVVRDKLLKISASTCERLLAQTRSARKPKGLCLTRPGTLKRQIAIRRGTDWSEDLPGFMEADLVAHSGSECAGEFMYTLTMTDVSTGWTEMAPLRAKGQAETLASIKSIRARLPFAMLGIDSDNGSEFINHHLVRYCQEERLVFTRGRPYAKNDGCRVEQKNWAVVRKHIGYTRLTTDKHFKTLREIYGILRLLVNFFEPSAKLLRKERTHNGTRKVFDQPKTPCQRLLDSERLNPEQKERLCQTYLTLNPKALREQLKALKRELHPELMVLFLDEATI